MTCSCGETTCGVLPTGVPPGMLGAQVLALIALLTADGHMSRRKVQSLLSAVFGLDVSLGTLSESEQIVSNAVAPAVDEARVHALTEKVKHLDATSWRESGTYRSLWTLATATVTVFTILGDGTRAHFVSTQATNVNFGRAGMLDAQLDDGQFRHCAFRDANLREGEALNAIFKDCDFRGADVAGRRFKGTTFIRCKFRGSIGTPKIDGDVTLVDPDLSVEGDGTCIVPAAEMLERWRQ